MNNMAKTIKVEMTLNEAADNTDAEMVMDRLCHAVSGFSGDVNAKLVRDGNMNFVGDDDE
jgi:hypothetical protein